jgi:phage terminase large subunit GpA-like protein
MIEFDQDIDLSLVDGLLAGIQPDPLMTVSEWADAKRILPQTSAEPGRYQTKRTPYLREIMDKLSAIDPAQKIIGMKGSQLGFTDAGNNWVGYSMDISPAPFIFIMPTDAVMKKTSKQRIEPMINDTPELKQKVPKARGKDGGNTLLYKEYPGGFITMVGANSPVGLSSTPAKNIYGDEIDRYPQSVGSEGSAVDLADTRTSTFGNRRKIFLTSTPTRKGTSQIEIEFEKTGQRYYHVPCPHCAEKQVLDFYQLRYAPGKYTDVKYECVHCKELIEEHHKTEMLEAGTWIPKFPEKEDGYVFGYHISAMYSPYGFYSWSKMAKDYDDAQGNTPKLIVFTNTKLGESYEEMQGDKPDWEALYDRAEPYELNKPFASVVFITAGVDVQADRLEIEIVGWSKGKISQQIDYRVLVGDTATNDVWIELSKIVNETWIRQGDKAILPVRYMCVDSGWNTEKVYQFTKKHTTTRVIPIKGMEKLATFFGPPKTTQVVKAGKKIGKVKVWGIGTNHTKSEIYGNLKVRVDPDTGEVPEGYCYFPKRETTYFRGLTAEEIILTKNKKGYDEHIWVKKYKRNEPLDCRVYARAGAALVGMDNWNDERWNRELLLSEPAPETEVPEQKDEEQKTNNRKPKKGSFWSGR